MEILFVSCTVLFKFEMCIEYSLEMKEETDGWKIKEYKILGNVNGHRCLLRMINCRVHLIKN